MPAPALLVDAITVEFGRFRAIDALSLAIEYGEIRAVIGPNGAGKTTLLDVISGISRPRRGRVMLDGTMDITRAGDAAIARAGVRRKFQKPSIFEGLTVRQHILVGVETGLRRRSPDGARAGRVEEVLDVVGLASEAHRPAADLAHGQKQWLEIGMVLASDPKVLMLDEPVAGLSDEETARTVTLVRSLRRPDRAVVVVEHDMDFVERVADRVIVMHEGRTLFEGSMGGARVDPDVVDVYLGR